MKHQDTMKSKAYRRTKVTDSDEVLQLKLAKQGDVEAFEKLIEQYQKRIYNYVRYLCKNEDEAFDLTQETFLKAFKGLHTFKEQSHFSTWLHRIANNTVMDYYRKKKGVHITSIDSGVEESDTREGAPLTIQSGDKTPEKILIGKERRAFILHNLSQLPVPLKSVVVLRDIYAYSYEEIAAVLKLPLGTVKSRLSRGRKVLQEVFLKNRELFEHFGD